MYLTADYEKPKCFQKKTITVAGGAAAKAVLELMKAKGTLKPKGS